MSDTGPNGEPVVREPAPAHVYCECCGNPVTVALCLDCAEEVHPVPSFVGERVLMGRFKGLTKWFSVDDTELHSLACEYAYFRLDVPANVLRTTPFDVDAELARAAAPAPDAATVKDGARLDFLHAEAQKHQVMFAKSLYGTGIELALGYQDVRVVKGDLRAAIDDAMKEKP